ncbi:MAG TPA: hypothetical protein VLR90_16115 [Blastocatellia bacterium]|nr:hypothetical protein [Blastocatellia bacterium]
MKRLVSVLLTLVFTFGLSIVSMAQSTTPNIDKRERHQQRRIRRGVNSGSLTKREAYRLERQQARTHAQEAAAKADGVVTGKERRHLRHREARTSRHVYRQKHDAQTRKP